MTDFTQDLLDAADCLTVALDGHDVLCTRPFNCEDSASERCLTQGLRRAVGAYRSPEAARERVEFRRAAERGNR